MGKVGTDDPASLTTKSRPMQKNDSVGGRGPRRGNRYYKRVESRVGRLEARDPYKDQM